MKRFMLILALMLPMVATWAQKWTPKTNRQYDAETVIKVKVNVNGKEVGTDPGAMIGQLAAFIGDECRAAAYGPTLYDNDDMIENIFVLRVAGSTGAALPSDMGKDITFKVFTDEDGAVYNFTKKSTFNGDGDDEAELIVLNLDKVTDVQMPTEIKVRKKISEFPCDVELADQAIYVYGEDGYTPKNESSLDGYFDWAGGATVNGAASSYATGTTVTIAEEDATDDNYFDVSISGHFVGNDGIQIGMDYNLTVGIRIEIANTPVSSISCDLTAIDEFYAYENLHDYLVSHVTILPAEANQNFYLTVSSERGGTTGFNVPTEGGYYTVSINPEDQEYTGRPAQVMIKVYVRPRSISLTNPSMEFHLGDDVKKALTDNITYTWPNGSHPGQYAKNDLEFTFDGTYVSSEGKAIQLTNGSRATATATLKNGLTVLSGDANAHYVNMVVVINSAMTKTARVNEVNYQRNVNAEKSPVLVEVNNPYNEPFDYNDLAMTFTTTPAPAQVESIYEVSKVGAVTTYGFKIKAEKVSQRVVYQVKCGEELLTPLGAGEASSPWYITISATQNLVQGWNWVSFNTLAAGTPAIEDVFTVADINEARTQDQIVFNDARRGLMGDLKNINPTQGMMKVYANKATTLNLGTVNVFNNYRLDYDAQKGFNWVNNPYEFDIPADYIADYFNLPNVSEGDMMLTRNGFATYSEANGKWVSTGDFALGCGQGIIYYTTADRNHLTFNSAAVAPVRGGGRGIKAKAKAVNQIFTYDASAYADNMAIIANIEGLQNPENYSIGVFAGEECRGNGQYVEEVGLMFINAVGKRNENFTFKLFNNETGEMFDITETVTCTTIKGSLQAPVQLYAPIATGINHVTASQLGNGKTYDLSGRQVQQTQKGLYIIDGKKVIK